MVRCNSRLSEPGITLPEKSRKSKKALDKLEEE